MKFFADAGRVTEVSELLEQSRAYKEYLQSVKERLPLAAFEFVTASWHYDHWDHRCPHDSWVDSLTIHEPATGGRLQNRSLRISTRLLGHSTTAISPGRLMFTNPYVLESRELEER
jgi:hypothetical protein